MKHLPLAFTGLLGGACLLFSIAEYLLWLLEGRRSAARTAKGRQSDRQIRSPATLAVTEPLNDWERLPARPTGKPGVLIANDHHKYRRILKRWFTDHGFMVWEAASGVEALKLYRANSHGIGLALLNVHLPGLDGPGTLLALRRETPTLPCCFMTSSLTAPQESILLAQGAAHVFEKPLLLREATMIISSLIDREGGESCTVGRLPSEQSSG